MPEPAAMPGLRDERFEDRGPVQRVPRRMPLLLLLLLAALLGAAVAGATTYTLRLVNL